MTPNAPQAPAPRAASRRWRWGLVVLAALLLAGGAAEAWRRSHRPAPAIPPMPDLPDAEVRQAVEHARQRVLEAPGDAGAWGQLGMVLLAHQLYPEADGCFAEAARLDPAAPNWPYGRALIALKINPEAAPALLRQALAEADGWPELQSAARLRLAEALLERQELDEAARLFQDELRRRPGEPRAALGLGMVALARDDARAAEAYLNQARSSPLARKRATVQLAALARAAGDLAAAAKYDREAAQLPDDAPWPDPFREQAERLRVGHYAWLQQEGQLEDQHRFAEAAAVYLQEARERPTARAYARAGFNLAQAGDFDQGVKYLREAVRLEPSSAHAHFLFAFTLFVRAETEWKRAAGSRRAREWFRECVAEARRAAELQPTQARAYLFWGRSLKYLGEPAAAVEPLRRGVECAPDNFPLQLTLGEALLEAGRYAEAEVPLKNAQKLSPNDPRPAQALARLPRPGP